MKAFWPFFSFFRAPASPRPQGGDPALTASAADLLRAVGCPDLAARVSVCWHARLSSTAGIARMATSQVMLNPRLRDFPGETERTLRHELAHLVAHARAKKRRVAAHGPEWRQACADLAIPGETRCHALPLPRRQVRGRHVYRCPACAFTLRRVRPINSRRRRLACHDCCKQHARGRFDARFEFVRIDHPV